MTTCVFCGSALPATAHFCGKCGRVQEGKAESATVFNSSHQVSPSVAQPSAPVARLMAFPINGQMPVGSAPFVQGTPHIGGVPVLQGSPQAGGNPSIPVPSPPAHAAPPPQGAWQTHNAPASAAQHIGQTAGRVAVQKLHLPVLRTAVSKAIAASLSPIL